jgi:hypothetical protein
VRKYVVLARLVRPGQGVKYTTPGQSNLRGLFE